jgi:phospholipid/cholesterol/gamma-HCH transport system ATP-binding protein
MVAGERKNAAEISGLYFKHSERPVFADVNITIPRGKIVAIMGPSGSGKTTLLCLISTQIFW